MAALDQALADAILSLTLGVEPTGETAVLSTLPLRVRLLQVNGNEVSPGEEIVPSGEGGYLGGPNAPVIEFSAPVNASASNLSDVTIPSMPAATIVGVEIWDSGGDGGPPEPVLDANGDPVLDANGQPEMVDPPGPGSRRWFGALATAKPVNEGDTFTIAAGSLTVVMA